MNSNIQLQGSWEDLATFLNSLGQNGKEKDVKSWKTVSIYDTGYLTTLKLLLMSCLLGSAFRDLIK